MKTKLQLILAAFMLISILNPGDVAMAQGIPELMYFKFNTSSGSNVPNEAQTSSRVSVNGTLNGATIGGTGQFNTALQGNGGTTASNSLDANWATNLSGPWTISLWMKGITSTASSNYIFGGSGGSTFRAFTGTGLVSGGGNLMVRGSGMTDVLISGVFDASGSGVVVHVVYDPTAPAIRAYINGTLAQTVTQTSTMTLTGTNFTIGGQASSNGIPSGSLIDEFRMYNRALSATEIANTWNIELNPGPPCPPVATINFNNINSTSVDFSWPAVTGSNGYEYVVDQNSGGPTGGLTGTTNLNAYVGGLTPATQYYVHVRNECSLYPSAWTTQAFTTLTPCSDPANFTVLNIADGNAAFTWNALATATEYQYIVNQDRSTPASPAGATITTNNSGGATGLNEGEYYYVHIRTMCVANDSSGWSLDSIYMPVECRTPVIDYRDINSSRAVVFWPKQTTAYKYEIINSATQLQNPSVGIEIYNNSYLLPFLDPGTTFYTYVRAYCVDKGVATVSDWGDGSFATWALGVNEVATGGQGFTVFPNPATNQITVVRGDGRTGEAALYITDITGKVVMNSTLTDKRMVIDIEHLPQGVYMVKYTDDQGTGQVKLNKE